MKLNQEELIIGAIFGLCFGFTVGLWALALAPLTAYLWALGGTTNKLYRRLGVPIVTCVVVYLLTHNYIALFSIPLGFLVLSLGYGIPDLTDEGSIIGRLAYRYAAHNPEKAHKYTRTIIYVLLALAFLPCLVAK